MSLETVVKLVIQHSSESLIPTENHIDNAEAERIPLQRMVRWMMWGMLLLGIGVLMLVTNKYFDLGRWFGLAAAPFLLGGVAIATYGVLAAVRDGAAISGRHSRRSITGTTDPKSLPTNPIPASLPSITERTTQLISAEDASKPQDR
jgi:hypothetical protein